MAVRTENFRKQHAELLEVARKIEATLVPSKLIAGATETRTLVGSLIGKLMIHLTMEDKAQYPKLLQHADAGVSDTVKKFMAEMSGIAPQVQKFGNTWTEPAIRSDPTRFSTEMRQIFAALGDRIQREDGQLYAMVDQFP